MATQMAVKRRVIGKLTSKEVTANKPPGRYSDGGNLYLEVTRSGTKSWTFIYKLRGAARSRQMGLGPVEFVSLPEARKLAADAREMVWKGIDPLGSKKPPTTKQERTFRECAEAYIVTKAPAWTNKKTPDQWRSSLKAYAFDRLGDMDVADITTDDVYQVLKPIWRRKEDGGNPTTAGRVRERIENILDSAKARGLRSGDNPAAWKANLNHLLPKLTDIKEVKHHASLHYSEISQFLREVQGRPGTSARALEFAVLTGARTKEVIGAPWSEIDLEAKAWSIPKGRMKARRDHRVPLSEAAMTILKSLPQGSGDDIVFLGPSGSRPMSNNAILALLKRMGRKGEITTHGFRSTIRNWAADMTTHSREAAEMTIAHKVAGATEGSYWTSDIFDKRRALMEDWASYCATVKPEKADD